MSTVSLKGFIPMSRRTSSWVAIACLTLSALTTACDRLDNTGPSEVTPALENQGSNN